MKTSAPIATVDAQHPWLGLVSFTEETRGYFHGREEEAAELSRRVQRKLLTVLFGQSGLGKTSILQAGLVPRLRPEGFCPVYVRLDYDPQSPSPAEQIKRAVFRATGAAGSWTQTGSAVSGETLWEFLHHRDDVLKDASGRTLIPILIFDQFEEIFTLAQSDDAGRKRAQEFLADLADLVENRPPVALEARIDRDEADAAKFDFARADYRILISLREDYLAHLEGLKAQMPSVTQNRMRLARMTGAQAVDAVRAPAPHLVSVSVAESVVRFVAGGTDLAHAEVEPSLLSLICRELNNTRLVQGQAEISADLLAGSRDTILSEFYERALADQPPGVRIFIEDEMLTDSGFRESVAEERVRKGFVAAGATPEALALLVDRRLLRVEDRLDLRRVEITHDVLCSVIGASRNVRRERQALEDSKRQLATQKEHELKTHRALVRARWIAGVAVVLMLAAAGSAVFGWINLRRAQVAERRAIAVQQLADNARGEAEKLVGFLLEDFYDDLAPTGRLETVRKLAQQAVAYYDGLPPALRTPATERKRATALMRLGWVQLNQGDTDRGTASLREAIGMFDKLRAAGDGSEDSIIGLALALGGQAILAINEGRPETGVADMTRALDLLRPVATAPGSSRRARFEFANLLNYHSHQQTKEEGIAACQEARRILEGLGALDLSDLAAASAYGDVSDSEARHAAAIDRFADAERLEKASLELAEKILLRRPGDLRAMLDRCWGPDVLGRVEKTRFHPAAAEDWAVKNEHATDQYVQFNPSDAVGWGMRISSRENAAEALWAQGRITAADERFHALLALQGEAQGGAAALGLVPACWWNIALLAAQRGDRAGAEQAMQAGVRVLEANERELKTDEFGRLQNREYRDLVERALLLTFQEYDEVARRAQAALGRIEGLVKRPEATLLLKENFSGMRHYALVNLALATLQLGRAPEAETAARAAADGLQGDGLEINREANRAFAQSLLALALTRQGRGAEALAAVEPAVAMYRAVQGQGGEGLEFRHGFAFALYAQAVASVDDAAGHAMHRTALDEARTLLNGLSEEARQLHDQQELSGWIAAARAKTGD